jgi:hypothetical protein
LAAPPVEDQFDQVTISRRKPCRYRHRFLFGTFICSSGTNDSIAAVSAHSDSSRRFGDAGFAQRLVKFSRTKSRSAIVIRMR